jgi:hypothetical protein
MIAYKNRWYNIEVCNGNILIRDINTHKIIVNKVYYRAEYGVVRQIIDCGYIGKGSAIVDDPSELRIGDDVEIRSEYRAANIPYIHKTKIVSIIGNKIYYRPIMMVYPRDVYYRLQRYNGINKVRGVYDEIFKKRGLFFYKKTHHIEKLNNIKIVNMKLQDLNVIHMIGSTEVSEVDIYLYSKEENPTMKIDLSTKYKDSICTIYESIELEYQNQIKEVYLKNGKREILNARKNYWLGSQGYKYEDTGIASVLYNPSCATSIRIDTSNKTVKVYLDHVLDHRYRTIKKNENDKTLTFNELHAAKYRIGEIKNNRFNIYFGSDVKTIPRLMNAPYGYLSTFIWTEHADRASIRTHRAVYYGSEDIKNIDDCTGGFVKYKIPVTKSVYYDNPAMEYIVGLREYSASIKTSQEYQQFLDELNSHGIYEICLHSVQPRTAHREKIEEAVAFMKERYDMVTWIDHDVRNNDEDISAKALDSRSSSYAKDIWERYNIKYFWHYASEDYGHKNLNLLQNINGEDKHTPLYWKHPSMMGDFYSFSSIPVTPRFMNRYWGDYINKQTLNQLISNWGVCILHTYPALADRYFGRSSGGWKYSKKNRIYVSDDFENCLINLTEYRDRGDLYLTTIRDIMEYWISLKSIEVAPIGSNKVNITNNNDKDVNGLSFAVNTKGILVNGIIPNNKVVNEDIIIWFDIKTNETVTITFE